MQHAIESGIRQSVEQLGSKGLAERPSGDITLWTGT